MVAYSFQKLFVPQVEGLTKRQTVRAERKRHARPGEAVQLYYAMRTKQCRKLIDPDPVCTGVDHIRMEISGFPKFETLSGKCVSLGRVEGIEINGVALDDLSIEQFAKADGFHSAYLNHRHLPALTARMLMGTWWFEVHGAGPWQGVVVHWA